jgi:hypothetical protein
VGRVLGGVEHMGRCPTYIWDRLGLVLRFRVGPQTNRFVEDKGSGKKEINEPENGLRKKTDLAKAKD